MVGVPLRHHERSAQGAGARGLYAFQRCKTIAGTGWFLAGDSGVAQYPPRGQGFAQRTEQCVGCGCDFVIGFLLNTARKARYRL